MYGRLNILQDLAVWVSYLARMYKDVLTDQSQTHFHIGRVYLEQKQQIESLEVPLNLQQRLPPWWVESDCHPALHLITQPWSYKHAGW
jgi:hypothetical protein